MTGCSHQSKGLAESTQVSECVVFTTDCKEGGGRRPALARFEGRRFVNVHSLSERKIQTYYGLVELAGELMQQSIEAHQMLDLFKVPRKNSEGVDFTLAERIDALLGLQEKVAREIRFL